MKELVLSKGNALIVVAHPDDETIWMGGTIAKFKNVAWTIFALCRKSDPDRMPKFMRVARHYKARGIICDLEDEDSMTIKESLPAIEHIIDLELPEKTFDYIFTHGPNGEYGHPRHKGVHRALQELIKNKTLKAEEVFYFAYLADKKKRMFNHPKATFATRLTREELRAKKNIIKNLYGFSRKSFENMSCLARETFTFVSTSNL